jgi:hypothetical protein
MWIAGVAALTALLVACGGDSDDDAGTTPDAAPTTAATVAAEPTEPAVDTPDDAAEPTEAADDATEPAGGGDSGDEEAAFDALKAASLTAGEFPAEFELLNITALAPNPLNAQTAWNGSVAQLLGYGASPSQGTGIVMFIQVFPDEARATTSADDRLYAVAIAGTDTATAAPAEIAGLPGECMDGATALGIEFGVCAVRRGHIVVVVNSQLVLFSGQGRDNKTVAAELAAYGIAHIEAVLGE